MSNSQINRFLKFLDERIPCIPSDKLIIILFRHHKINKIFWRIVNLAVLHKSKITSSELDNINLLECSNIQIPYVFSYLKEHVKDNLIANSFCIHQFEDQIINKAVTNTLIAVNDRNVLIVFDRGIEVKRFDYPNCAYDFSPDCKTLLIIHEKYEFYDLNSWECYKILPLFENLNPTFIKWISNDIIQLYNVHCMSVLLLNESKIFTQYCSASYPINTEVEEVDGVTYYFEGNEVLANIPHYEYALCLSAELNAGFEVNQLLEIINSELFKRIPKVGQNEFRKRYELIREIVERNESYF
jgi:hypothetical protein